MRVRFGSIGLLTLIVASSALAQDQAALERFFNGRHVVALIDMPATKDGVDIYADRMDGGQAWLSSDSYAERLRDHGIAIAAGDVVVVTKVKVKGRHIEFQLGGGGYGTLFDEDASVEVSYPSKSKHELKLEERLDDDDLDSERREHIEERLEELEHEREREYRRRERAAEPLRELKRQRIAAMALDAGSRFNVRFNSSIPFEALTTEGLLDALAGYVALESEYDAAQSNDELRTGMSIQEVEAILGPPDAVDYRNADDLQIRIMRFHRERSDIEVTFVDGVLVRYRIW